MKSEQLQTVSINKKEDLSHLLKETKETIARELGQEGHQRIFGSIDLWNRQKRQRTSLQMRRWLN